MKTALITTFAFALMVFAFNAAPAHANEVRDPLLGCNDHKRDSKAMCKNAELQDVQDPDQAGDGEKEFAYRIEAWCEKNRSLRDAICNEGGFNWIKKQFAGMTPRQKQQWDEDYWNQWILNMFASYQSDDNESFDGFDRDFADSGNEGSTSAAGADR